MKTGNHKKGPKPKLTTADVQAIHCEYASNQISQQQLADKYKVSLSTIYNLLHDKQRPHSSTRRGSSKLTPESVQAIRSEYAAGTAPLLAAKYGVSARTIYAAISGKCWKPDGDGASERLDVASLRHDIDFLLRRVAELDKRLTKVRARSAAKAKPHTPKPVPPEVDPLLDQIALGMAKKSFNKLNPLHQDTVRSIAERMKTGGAS